MLTIPTDTLPADGDALREARIAAGLSMEALAVLAGIAGSTVARIERGDSRPNRGTRRLLAAALESATTGP